MTHQACPGSLRPLWALVAVTAAQMGNPKCTPVSVRFHKGQLGALLHPRNARTLTLKAADPSSHCPALGALLPSSLPPAPSPPLLLPRPKELAPEACPVFRSFRPPLPPSPACRNAPLMILGTIPDSGDTPFIPGPVPSPCSGREVPYWLVHPSPGSFTHSTRGGRRV